MTKNLSIESNGTTVAGPVGAVWDLELPGHADGGYLWERAPDGSEKLGLLVKPLPPTSAEIQALEIDKRVGSSLPARFRITILEPGTYALKLVERRPWEENSLSGQDFSLLVVGTV